MVATYVNRLGNLVGDFAYKAPARVATTAPITLSGEQTIDGVAVSQNTSTPLMAPDRVLVKDQADATTNGLYFVTTTDWVRCADFDGQGDAAKGTQVYVNEGSTHAGSIWRLTTDDPVVIGGDSASNIDWTQATFGSGDVVGPSSSIDGDFVAFDGTTGKLIKDITAAQATAKLNVAVASGVGHAKGLVPDPGASSGTTKFLREDMTFAIPPGTGGGGGGLVYLDTQTASNSAALIFTTGFSDTYDNYLLILTGILAASGTANLGFQISNDGGSSWLASTNYSWDIYTASGGSVTGSTSSGTDRGLIALNLNSSAGQTVSGIIRFNNLRSAANYKETWAQMTGLDHSSALTTWTSDSLSQDNGNKTNGIKILMSSGNIALGKGQLYGIAQS